MREALARPSPMKKVRRRRLASKLFIFLLIIGAVFIGLGIFSGIPKLSITSVEVTGTESLDGTETESAILGSLAGKQWLVYSRANKFLFSKQEIIEFVMTTMPRVYRVTDIERNGAVLHIAIEERHAAYTWCGREAPVYAAREARGVCTFLDQEGFAFAPAPEFSEGVYLSVYGGFPEGDVIGTTINLQNNIAEVAGILAILGDNGLRVHSLVLGTDGQHAFLLDLPTVTGDYARILWNEDVPLEETLGKLGSALSEGNFREEFQKHGEQFLYIDTRFNNRVFYKFAGGAGKI